MYVPIGPRVRSFFFKGHDDLKFGPILEYLLERRMTREWLQEILTEVLKVAADASWAVAVELVCNSVTSNHIKTCLK